MIEKLRKNEDGQVLIIAIVLFLVGTAFAALVVDVGYLYAEKRQIQSAVDAAALSGAIVAGTEEGNQNKVREEVEKYLSLNLDEDINVRDINVQIDMGSPIYVTVDATGDYPAFFSRVFQKKEIPIAAHAKAKYVDFSFDPFPYSLFSEDEIIIFNGNKQEIVGPIYSKKPSKLDLDKVTIKDSDPDKNRTPAELIETAATGVVELPDYSSVIRLAKKMTFNEFEQTYLSGQKELSGVIEITGQKIKALSGTIKGKGVIYRSGDMELDGIKSSVGSSILFYAGGNITKIHDVDLCGTIYAPNGYIKFNGDPNNFGYGKILARDRLEFNGAKFKLEAYPAVDDWMGEISGGSSLVE